MNFAFNYYGRLGQQIENENYNAITDIIDPIAKAIKPFSSSAYDSIKSAESSLTDLFDSTAPYALGNPSRTW